MNEEISDLADLLAGMKIKDLRIMEHPDNVFEGLDKEAESATIISNKRLETIERTRDILNQQAQAFKQAETQANIFEKLFKKIATYK